MHSTQSPILQAIIPSAGKATRLSALLQDQPKALMRVCGKPLLLWTISQLAQQGVGRFIVVVSAQASDIITRSLQRSYILPGVTIEIVEQQLPLGPGQALACAAPYLLPGRVLVALGDTLFSERLPLYGNWIGTAQVDGGEQWCRVETNGDSQITGFFDKCPSPAHVNLAAVGLYHFDDAMLFSQCARETTDEGKRLHGEYQISSILDEYRRYRPLYAHLVSTWRDCGDIHNFAQANRSPLGTRVKNAIVIDQMGILTKRDSDPAMRERVQWYKELNDRHILVAPRLIEINQEKNYFRIEHLDLPTLGEIYLYDPILPVQMKLICAGLLETMRELVWPLVKSVDASDLIMRCRSMYIDKLIRRFDACLLNRQLSSCRSLEINGIPTVKPNEALHYLTSKLERVIQAPLPGFIHGDLHFSNILYSLRYDYFRLIDPRGNFSGPGTSGGDIRYDLSKLRHSYHGLYDAITNDLFVVKELDPGRYLFHLGVNRLDYVTLLDGLLESQGYDLDSIRLIEISFFLSMLPCHTDHPDRQLAFLLRALQMITDYMCEHN